MSQHVTLCSAAHDYVTNTRRNLHWLPTSTILVQLLHLVHSYGCDSNAANVPFLMLHQLFCTVCHQPHYNNLPLRLPLPHRPGSVVPRQRPPVRGGPRRPAVSSLGINEHTRRACDAPVNSWWLHISGGCFSLQVCVTVCRPMSLRRYRCRHSRDGWRQNCLFGAIHSSGCVWHIAFYCSRCSHVLSLLSFLFVRCPSSLDIMPP